MPIRTVSLLLVALSCSRVGFSSSRPDERSDEVVNEDTDSDVQMDVDDVRTPSATYTSISAVSPVRSDGVDMATVSLQLMDEQGRPVPGVQPQIEATDTGTTNVYQVCSVTNLAGRSTCLFSSRVAENKQVRLVSPFSKDGPIVVFDNCGARACQSADDCRIDFQCSASGFCVSGVGYVSDDFNDGVIDNLLWDIISAGAQAQTRPEERDGGLHLLVGANLPMYGEISSKCVQSAVNQSVNIVVNDVGNQSLASLDFYFSLTTGTAPGGKVEFTVSQNDLKANRWIAGAVTVIASTPYDAVNTRVLRLRESSNVTYWEYSSDGVIFTELAQAPSLPGMDDATVAIGAGTWSLEATSTELAVDQFNQR